MESLICQKCLSVEDVRPDLQDGRDLCKPCRSDGARYEAAGYFSPEDRAYDEYRERDIA